MKATRAFDSRFLLRSFGVICYRFWVLCLPSERQNCDPRPSNQARGGIMLSRAGQINKSAAEKTSEEAGEEEMYAKK